MPFFTYATDTETCTIEAFNLAGATAYAEKQPGALIGVIKARDLTHDEAATYLLAKSADLSILRTVFSVTAPAGWLWRDNPIDGGVFLHNPASANITAADLKLL